MSGEYKFIENGIYDALDRYLKREAWGLFVANTKGQYQRREENVFVYAYIFFLLKKKSKVDFVCYKFILPSS